jgi:hypothetical protein
MCRSARVGRQTRVEWQGEKRDAHAAVGQLEALERSAPVGPDSTTLARLCLNFVKHAWEAKNRLL